MFVDNYPQGRFAFAAVLLTAALVIYFIILTICSLTLHPLAKYPGPLIAKITDLYSTYHAWKGDRHLEFHRCHEKYGEIVRYGPNRLSFNTSTALHAIHSAKANVRKGDYYIQLVPPTGHNILTVFSKEDHSRKRRAMAHAFSEKALKEMEDNMLVHIRSFCEKMAGGVWDMSKWTSYLTADVLGDLCFGSEFKMLDEEENRFATEVMLDSAKLAMMTGSGLNLGNNRVKSILFSSLQKGRLRFRAFVRKHASARTSLPSSTRRDFFHYLMEAKHGHSAEDSFTAQELWAEASNLIVAGTDTSSMSLSAALFYLTRHPKCLERVRKEVRDAFAGEGVESIRSGAALTGCKYLRACIDEAMRLNPPVPGILPRCVLPGGIEIDGHSLATGVEVAVPIYALHHNPIYFEDPFAYRPDRWLAEDVNEEEIEARQKAFTPFSMGPRGCIGKNMAYMEMMATMARVLFLFEIRNVGTAGEGREDGVEGRRRKGEFQVRDCFISEKEGPMIEFLPAQ